jgi:hypothetical protein
MTCFPDALKRELICRENRNLEEEKQKKRERKQEEKLWMWCSPPLVTFLRRKWEWVLFLDMFPWEHIPHRRSMEVEAIAKLRPEVMVFPGASQDQEVVLLAPKAVGSFWIPDL